MVSSDQPPRGTSASVSARHCRDSHSTAGRTTIPSSTFYIDATDGSDGALGTSTTTAWQTLGRIGDETLSGEPLEELAGLSADIPYEIFGRELSMGKSMGLMGMVAMVQRAAKQRLSGSQRK